MSSTLQQSWKKDTNLLLISTHHISRLGREGKRLRETLFLDQSNRRDFPESPTFDQLTEKDEGPALGGGRGELQREMCERAYGSKDQLDKGDTGTNQQEPWCL